MSKARIVVCDDHDLIIEGLRSILASEFDVVGVASDGRELVRHVEQLKPDAVLLDVSMPNLNGIEAARQIRSSTPTAKIIFVTQQSDREYVRLALEIGASGYLLKQSVVSELVPAIQDALVGRCYVTPLLSKGLPVAARASRYVTSDMFTQTLTGRQREVLQLLAEGKSNKEIAWALNISPKTVDFHKAKLMDELGVRTTAEMTRYAIKHGIIDD